MADTTDSKSVDRNIVRVRVSYPVPQKSYMYLVLTLSIYSLFFINYLLFTILAIMALDSALVNLSLG